jgi:hypothetical protein
MTSKTISRPRHRLKGENEDRDKKASWKNPSVKIPQWITIQIWINRFSIQTRKKFLE